MIAWIAALALAGAPVVPTNRPLPALPDASDQLTGGDVACDVRLVVDRAGKVADARATGCAQGYAGRALDAAWQWTFQPATDAAGAPRRFGYEVHLGFQPSTGHTAADDVGEVALPAGPVAVALSELKVAAPRAPAWPEDLLQHPERHGLASETWCRVRASVGADGQVSTVEAAQCPAVLFEVVGPAVRAWRFQPPVIDGKAQDVSVVVPVLFRAR